MLLRMLGFNMPPQQHGKQQRPQQQQSSLNNISAVEQPQTIDTDASVANFATLLQQQQPQHWYSTTQQPPPPPPPAMEISGGDIGGGIGGFGGGAAFAVVGPRCPHCGKVYSNSSNLRQHVRNVHVAIDQALWHQCPTCAKRLKTKHYLINHQLQAHGIHQRGGAGGARSNVDDV